MKSIGYILDAALTFGLPVMYFDWRYNWQLGTSLITIFNQFHF